MKCLILAGGSGDRLWPLSRRNYPKQFMEIRKGRSMFQEAILRNIPFCDEFIIITNKRHESIVKAQLQDFQDLKYSILMEESPLKTAPSIITLALNFDGNEEFLIVSTDNIIDGEYNSCITHLKEVIKKDKIGVVAIAPKERQSGNHYFECSGGRVRYTTVWGKNCVVDCGIMGAKVSVLLKNVDPVFLEQCKSIRISENLFVENRDYVSHISVADVMKTDKFELVIAKITCQRITDILSYYNYVGKQSERPANSINFNCKDVSIINTAGDRLVVANDLKNILIANTKDAVYITRKDSKTGIKEISRTYYQDKRKYFDDYPVYYQDWGVEETLSSDSEYRVAKITVYPKCAMEEASSASAIVNFFVLDGSVETITAKEKEAKTFRANESVSFKGGTTYTVTNVGKTPAMLIKTENRKTRRAGIEKAEDSCFVKLKPELKDYIWGGDKIRDVLNKNVGKHDIVAESWELSAHSAGQSRIASGRYKGLKFGEYLDIIGKENLGWKAQDYERFPLLIKFIDAKENLSVQVHPDDEYAFPNEGDYGKNEMWYILGADKDAYIYMGFNKDVTKEEVRARLKNNTILDVLNKVPVKKGETYFLKARTVHAIGAGCLVCEIQQSSNVTYRMYDYGRTGYRGKPRELNIDKALEVLDTKKGKGDFRSSFSVLEFPGYTKQLLGQCKYFVSTKYSVDGELSLAALGASFRAIVVIEGSGKIGNGHVTYNTSLGDTWFFGSKEIVSIKGKLKVIIASI